jgi:hypothetical protein
MAAAIVAAQVLLRLVQGGGAAAEAFLAALVAMPLTLHGLEVVNRLTSATRLPPQHVAAYISGCIASCERAQACMHACVLPSPLQRKDSCSGPRAQREGLPARPACSKPGKRREDLMPAQDKAMQNRLVRLVCVFLQSLIRNNSVNLEVSTHHRAAVRRRMCLGHACMHSLRLKLFHHQS